MSEVATSTLLLVPTIRPCEHTRLLAGCDEGEAKELAAQKTSSSSVLRFSSNKDFVVCSHASTVPGKGETQ